ncbi:MAG: hypothetical protein HFE81_01120 [Bacilli bacterium]|nr:hypothetical protein [Bacilli bacterium]
MKRMFKNSIFFLILLYLLLFCPKVYAANDGWVYENNQFYYYRDGNKLKGFQEIEGKNYFFSYVTSA